MSKTSNGLLEHARSNIGVPYVYGTKMEILTKEKFDKLQTTYGKSLVWDSDAGKPNFQTTNSHTGCCVPI